MAGAHKNRQRRERKAGTSGSRSSDRPAEKSSSSNESKISPKQRSPPSAWDGNRDPGTGGLSRTGSDASRRSGSGRRTPSAERTATSTAQVYPARHAVINVNPRNLDLGMGAYFMVAGPHAFRHVASTKGNKIEQPRNLAKRPTQRNKTGQELAIKLNTFNVASCPAKVITQYDVLIGNGAESRGLVKNIWSSKTTKGKIGNDWIFDGNKIAWSLNDMQGQKAFTVDLDEEKGRKPRHDGKGNSYRVQIRKSGAVRFELLRAYLDGKADFDNPVLEAYSFMDHLMREGPAQKHTSIKRSFFSRGETRNALGQGVEAYKGVYSSIRAALPAIDGQLPSLTVNVDVANTAFWMEHALHLAAKELLGTRDLHELVQKLKSRQDGKPVNPQAWLQLSKMKKLYVFAKHLPLKEGQTEPRKLILEKFIPDTARTWTFKWLEDNTNREVETSVMDYFRRKYGHVIQFPDLPLVKTVGGKKDDKKTWTVHPMEVLYISAAQRYPYKLSDRQTSEMIKFAVTLPDQRWKAIEHGLRMLDWRGDANLSKFGLKVSDTPVVVKARLLKNPHVVFGAGSAKNPVDPRASGRWDLMQKKFLEPGRPLKSWGVCIMPGRQAPSVDQVKAFITTFVNTMLGHGMRIEQRQPKIMVGGPDVGEAVASIFAAAGDAANQRPQLLVFIVPDKDSHVYMRLKKSCDCRFGLVSQILQSAHVQKAQGQYCSNVAMKVNAKLGGVTARADSTAKPPRSPFKVPTVIVGADVSHGAPGTEATSIAAMTVSFDRAAIRYAAAVETNGHRVEMITTANIESMLKPLLQEWSSRVANGAFPGHVIYFRDGVSDGQYPHVIGQEVRDMKQMLSNANPKASPKFTVIVATKRHHVRFFPEKGSGDKNNNPQPGTLVETGVTHPFEYDFYLCAHSAIKGTARPVHYVVLQDEMNIPPAELQALIYEHSYQYVRSTTPVSLFPAVYYAHLASNRGLHHLDVKAGSGPKDTKAASSQQEVPGTSPLPPTEAKPLLPMPNNDGIRTTMWFV